MVSIANTSHGEAQELITPGHGLQISDLLADPALSQARVLSGKAGTGRRVTGVRALDVRDALTRISAGDLVVTGPWLLGEVGAQLWPRQPAGLAVRRGHGLPSVPDHVLRAADERDIAVVELPETLGYDDLLEMVYSRLNRDQSQVLARIDELHQALSRLVLDGSDLTRIADMVASVLDVGILVTSTDGRERASALSDEVRRRLADRGLFDPTGRFRVERVGKGVLEFGHGEVRIARIASAGTDLARMVCVSPDRPLESPDVQALERAAMVAALLITREHAVAAVENKYRGDFLRDIFLGRAGSDAFVLEHAQGFGWDIDRPLVVLSAEVDPPGPEERPVAATVTRALQERFSAAWGQVCRAREATIPSVDFSTEVVTLLPACQTDTGQLDEVALRADVRAVVEGVAGDRGGGRKPFSVGVSRVVTELSGLPAAYNQARRATQVGRRISGGRSTTFFDDLGVHRLIALVPDQCELREFAEDVLGELAGESTEAADLRTTLQVLLDTNFNVAEAARLQFFHYNTMRYRVNKLERMLGPFSTDPHLRLNLAVALQVLEMPHG
ncbi:helix-turn-helix domain-containing protein [Nocardioides sp.]|uniref:helix-turn-helix domain-containing protein n=1 Tax=Nocardioides sp. TaxID=35761 RepID=UPI002735A948|nr:helix-turn-helix domain-containing protein [Nocardioides sp.]MDP3892362.1 helix-turn-helix domain-containing protein [Nocardioides sp.]